MRLSLLSLLIFSGVSFAAPTIYQEQNFSIELPEGWQKADAPPETLLLVRSPDGTKALLLIASKLSAKDKGDALAKMVKGAKDAAAKDGIAITEEHDLDIDGIPFHSYSCSFPNKMAITSNMGVAGQWGYAMQGMSSTSFPSTDPEIQNSMHSFRLLSPVPVSTAPLKAAGDEENAAYRLGRITGTVAMIALIIGAIFLPWRKSSKRNKA